MTIEVVDVLLKGNVYSIKAIDFWLDSKGNRVVAFRIPKTKRVQAIYYPYAGAISFSEQWTLMRDDYKKIKLNDAQKNYCVNLLKKRGIW